MHNKRNRNKPIIAGIKINEAKAGEKYLVYFKNDEIPKALTIINPKTRTIRLFGEVFTHVEDLYLGEAITLKKGKEGQKTLPVVRIVKSTYQGFNKNSLKSHKC